MTRTGNLDAEKIMEPNYDIYSDKCVGYVMPREKSVDIDSKMDLILAEIAMDN